ncbi:Protein TIC 20-II, chloroplastic [Trebouxia sp. C0009 RCD-2024]
MNCSASPRGASAACACSRQSRCNRSPKGCVRQPSHMSYRTSHSRRPSASSNNSQQTRCQATSNKFTAQLLSLAAAGVTSLAAGSALATSKIGEFSASGFIFKDSVEAVAVEDPDVKGVTIYISDFKRSISDKLNKDFFSEPSQASVTCALTGPLQIQDMKAISGAEGHEVFSERKGLSLFQNKTLRVRRLYDEQNQTLLYVAYSTRLNGSQNNSGSRYKTSICALPVAPSVSPAASSPSSQFPDTMK